MKIRDLEQLGMILEVNWWHIKRNLEMNPIQIHIKVGEKVGNSWVMEKVDGYDYEVVVVGSDRSENKMILYRGCSLIQ